VIRTRTILTLLLTFSGLLVLPQPDYNRVDDEGRRHGPWKKFFNDGGVRYEGTFEHGEEVGKFTFYYPDGVPAAIKEYRVGPGDCYATMYHVNGKLFAQGSYVDTFKIGTWNYWDVQGNFIAQEQYVDGVQDGAQYSFYTDSTIAEITHFERGTLQGEWRLYFDDGTLRAAGTYENGALSGVTEYYNPTGDMDSKGKYYQGEKDGWWIFYENKKPVRKVLYDRGKEIESQDL